MPARIIVEAGAHAGQEFPIEEPLFRLGSGSGCKLRLSDAGLPEHAVTVEYRNRRYRVVNKTDRPLKLDAQAVEVQGGRDWLAGQRLVLPAGVVLRLDVEGDPAPARRAQAVVRGKDIETDQPAESENKPAEPAAPSKTWQWVAMVAGVALLVGSFVFRQADQPGTTSEPKGTDVYGLINELKEVEGADPVGEPAWRALQDADMWHRRGLMMEANRAYRDVTRILRQRHGDRLEGASEIEKKVDVYARKRLESEE